MAGEAFTIRGSVLSRYTGFGIDGLRVEAWDKAGRIKEPLGAAATDNKGRFRLDFTQTAAETIAARAPEIYFRVLNGKELVASTEQTEVWSVKHRTTKSPSAFSSMRSSMTSASRPNSSSAAGWRSRTGPAWAA